MSRTPTIRVLIIEDDERLGALTEQYLRGHEIETTRVYDGAAGIQEASRGIYDAIVLDLMLPGIDGIDVCRTLRQRYSTPILMLTARGEEADRVIGLEAGADDYVTKPFSARELLARLRAQIRRARGQVGPADEPRVLRVGRLSIVPNKMVATIDGRTLDLTSHEFAVLRVLAEDAGHVLTRERLLERARGAPDEAFDRAIDVQISRLRSKLGDDARHPRLLKTVRGVGYMLVNDQED